MQFSSLPTNSYGDLVSPRRVNSNNRLTFSVRPSIPVGANRGTAPTMKADEGLKFKMQHAAFADPTSLVCVHALSKQFLTQRLTSNHSRGKLRGQLPIAARNSSIAVLSPQLPLRPNDFRSMGKTGQDYRFEEDEIREPDHGARAETSRKSSRPASDSNSPSTLERSIDSSSGLGFARPSRQITLRHRIGLPRLAEAFGANGDCR